MDANEFRRLIVNLIRKGSVFDVDLTSNPPMCRVSVGDPDDADNPGLVTNWIPFLTLRAGTTREWNPLTKGEKVVLLCPMGDPAQGVALAGLNSEDAPAPSSCPDKHMRVYPDRAAIEYDHAQHALTATLPAGATVLIDTPGAVTVQTKAATVEAEERMTRRGQHGRLDSNMVGLDSCSERIGDARVRGQCPLCRTECKRNLQKRARQL